MPKIHVMRHKLELDIEVDPTSHDSLDHAAGVLTSINAHVAGLDHAILKITDSRLARVAAPTPEAAEPETGGESAKSTEPAGAEWDDDLAEMPENLRRVTP